MANVLLLRSPSTDGPDRYETAFKSIGYHPTSVPVLETVLMSLDILEGLLKAGPAKGNYGGIIITSGRSCEAWRHAIERLEAISSRADEVEPAGWQTIPFYVVGKATSSSLREVRDSFPHSSHCPRDIRGESSGNSEQLAHLILEDLEGKPARLLYLTGDKNRDTLPKILGQGGIDVHNLQTYETRGSSSFPLDLTEAIASGSKDRDEWWVVFFAPSAAEFVQPHLGEHFRFRSSGAFPIAEHFLPLARVAAIGPTTSSYLQDSLNLIVDVVASKPTTEDLVATIRSSTSSPPR